MSAAVVAQHFLALAVAEELRQANLQFLSRKFALVASLQSFFASDWVRPPWAAAEVDPEIVPALWKEVRPTHRRPTLCLSSYWTSPSAGAALTCSNLTSAGGAGVR